jgi:hypothetical protein
MTRRLRTLLVAVAVSFVLPSVAHAQAGPSFWAAYATAADSGKAKFETKGVQLGAQIALPIMPLAIRVEALAWGSDLNRFALIPNALLQLRLPLLTAYGIAGWGTYPVDGSFKTSGWNAGGGVRIGAGRLGLFAEVRRHDAIERTVTTLGLTF